jgi:hypothetical protein
VSYGELHKANPAGNPAQLDLMSIRLEKGNTMGHVGVICPNTPGHVNPMLALADAIRTRGHRVTFFLVGSPPSSIAAAGFESVPLGGSVFPSDQYQA